MTAFDELTEGENGHEWAISAAIFVAGFSKRRHEGPTFNELFRYLLDDHSGLPARIPAGMRSRDRADLKKAFRHHVALAWRRTGMISWATGEYRSLHVGPAFRKRSRMRRSSPHSETKVVSDA
ncbi:hypothetical protein [Frondihabitans sp. PhB188]|uniref:hypothetical protein n=1 Tax=Frondihabitans sp. PhB188 TaxID=2485200 RepID=UPI0011CE150B|nr:hypothetical protein [Frondihabitans sp. PhB188]